MKIPAGLVRPSLYSYLAPRLGFIVLVLMIAQYLSALLYALLVWDVALPEWVNWYWVQATHFWFGVALSVFVGVKSGTLVGKLLSSQLWRPGPGSTMSRINAIASILLLVDFAVIFITGLGIMFRFYYAYLSIPFVDVRWLETHLWAAILSVPLFIWHLVKYFNVSVRIAAPKTVELPTGGAASSPSRRRALVLTLGAASAVSFSLSFWPLQWLRFLNGPAWEDGFPVERILGMADEIDPSSWRLRVTGDVARPLELSYDQLMAMAMRTEEMRLSCVTGWTTVQQWTGVPVADILALAGASPAYQQVEFKGASGYSYQWWRDELEPQALVVTAVGGKVLSHGHGFPARLMAPNRPGQNNVKQLVEMYVSVEAPKIRNSDLRIRG